MKNGRSWKDGKKGGGSRGWVVYFLLFVSNILKAKGGEQKKMFYIRNGLFLGNVSDNVETLRRRGLRASHILAWYFIFESSSFLFIRFILHIFIYIFLFKFLHLFF